MAGLAEGRSAGLMACMRAVSAALVAAIGLAAAGCGGGEVVGPVMPTFPAEMVPEERIELTETATPTVTAPATAPATATTSTSTAEFNAFGISSRERVELSAAVFDLTAEIERDPDVVWTYIERGEILMRLGELDAAIEDFTAALRVGGESQEVYASRAVAHALNGNMARAQEDLDTAAALGYPPTPLQEMFESLRQSEEP